jgi:predicted TIM-barrel fold metal-dependent hydrolase
MMDPVIDADGHIMEQHDDLFRHIRGPYGDLEWHGTWPLFDADGWQRGLARQGRREDPDADAWLRFQDEHGISMSVVYPTAGLALGKSHLPDWAAALSQGYNDWLADRFTRVTPRIKGVALLAPQDPAAAAAELRRSVTEHGFVGGCVPGATNEKTPLYGHPSFDVLWDEAQRLDVPVAVHGGVTTNLGLDRVTSFAEAHCLEHPFAQMLQMTNMVFQGVFDRFPRLRVAFLEAGVGWVPYMMDRLDEDAEKFGSRLATPLKRAPSEYLKSGNIFFTAEVEEDTLPYVLSLLGDEVILWASDYPHERERDEFGGDIPYFRARKDISDAAKQKILYDNALRYYRMQPAG